MFTAFAKAFFLLIMITLSSCSGIEPETVSSSAARTAEQRTSEIYATACRPEWCYRSLGEVAYVEPFSLAKADPQRIVAMEDLKRLALKQYAGQVDAIIKLHATGDAMAGRMVVSGEAVQIEHGASLRCSLQTLGSAMINIFCDSERKGMIGDAEEYERLYNSLP